MSGPNCCVALILGTNRVIECDVKCWCFNPYTMWAFALQMEKDRGKPWPGWELNPRPSGLITAAPPTELQGQTGAGCGKWRCLWHGNEYVDTRKGYVALARYGRVALILGTNRVIECDVKCWCFNPYTMWAFTLQMEIGPHKDRGKPWPGWANAHMVYVPFIAKCTPVKCLSSL